MPEHALEHNPIRHVEHIIQKDARGKEVGEAELYILSDPFPFCYVKDLKITEDAQGQGFGSLLIEQVNTYIRAQHMPGLLVNGAFTRTDVYDIQTRQKIPIHTFYGRHEWHPVPYPGMMIFNKDPKLTDNEVWDACANALRHVGI